jgi:excisionase family DNA binding protein
MGALAQPLEPDSSGPVKVIHGANDGVFMVAGITVGRVRASLKDAFNIPAGAAARRNRLPVTAHAFLRAGDVLEFIAPWGRKGAGEDGDDLRRRVERLERVVQELLDREQSPYLNAEEAAKYLRITPNALYGLVERRKLRPLPGFRKYRFTREMLDHFLRGE